MSVAASAVLISVDAVLISVDAVLISVDALFAASTVCSIAVGSLASATKKAFPNVEDTIRNAVTKDNNPLVARFIINLSLQQNFIFIRSPPNKISSRRIVPI